VGGELDRRLRLVLGRHAIYTGLVAAMFALAAIKASLAAILGAILMTLGLWLKARLEERFLRQKLDPQAYDAYAKRTPQRVPFLPT
jgi:protein-S-isoprenylcysteine O-methyltransferase Ste14